MEQNLTTNDIEINNLMQKGGLGGLVLIINLRLISSESTVRIDLIDRLLEYTFVEVKKRLYRYAVKFALEPHWNN